jgi:hypothetical protein
MIFQVTLTNWQGKSSSSSITVEIKQQVVPQLVVLGGESQSFPKDQPLVINAQITPSACVKQFTVVASWIASCSSPAIQNAWNSAPIAKSGLKLMIPAYTLPLSIESSLRCVFMVTVTQSGSAADGKTLLSPVTVTSNVSVVFTESPPFAIIDQGNQVVSSARELYLSAAGSFDPDLPPASRSGGLLFCWSCVNSDGSPCVNWTSIAVAWSNITIGRGLLSPSSQYLITVTVGRNYGSGSDPSSLPVGTCSNFTGLNSSSTVQINTAPAGVDPPVATITPLKAVKISVSEFVRLSGSVFGNAARPNVPVRYAWSISPNPSNFLNYNQTALDGNAVGPISLVIAPGILQGNQMYTIQLTSTYNSLSSQAFIRVLMNNPPESGTFTISPSTGGQAIQTTFTLTALSWTDQDLPIYTSFGFKDMSTNNDVLLGSPALLHSISTPLPQGDASLSGQLAVFLIVTDALGSSRRVGCGGDLFCGVPVSNFAGSCTVFEQLYTARKEQLVSLGDNNAVLAYAAIVGKALKPLSLSLVNCPGSSWSSMTSTIMQDVLYEVSRASASGVSGGSADSQVLDMAASTLVAALPDSSAMTPDMLDRAIATVNKLLSGNVPALSDATVGSLSKILDKVSSAFILQSIKTSSAFRRQSTQNSQLTAQAIFDSYTNLAFGGMQNKLAGELRTASNASVVFTVKRFAVVANSTGQSTMNYFCQNSPSPSECNSWDADRSVTIPQSLFQSLQGAPSTVDVLVVDFTNNPYAYAGNWSAVFGEIVRLQVLSTSGPSGTGSVLSFSGITPPVSIRIRVSSAPPSNRNPTTGRYAAAGCSSWLDLSASVQSSSTWNLRAGLATLKSATIAGNRDPVPSIPAPGFITCLVSQSAAESLSTSRYNCQICVLCMHEDPIITWLSTELSVFDVRSSIAASYFLN